MATYATFMLSLPSNLPASIMITFPNAKINLGLHITEKRSDGFHNLETVFYPVPWKDALEIVPSKGSVTTLSVSGKAIEGDPENNLVMKAYRLLEKDYQLLPLDIYLLKAIPFGAGLGGGSADAAFMLKLLSSYFGLKLTNEQLVAYAAQLGSDCPFFIYNRPMLAAGRGEVLVPIDISLAGYTVVLVKPDFSISTPEAFSGITPKQPTNPLIQTLLQPVETWKDRLVNDFEDHLFAKHPQLAAIKAMLYDKGATYAAMSGSGSTIFGLFREDVEIHVPSGTVFKATL